MLLTMIYYDINSLDFNADVMDKLKQEPDQPSYRWVMLALLWLLYMSFGLVISTMASLVSPIQKDLSLTYAQMGFILGSWQLTYIVSSIGAGQILDKWGIHKSVFAGALLIAASAGLRYFPEGFGALLPVVALFGLGGPMISIGGPKTISVWFKGKGRATALSVFMTGSSSGMLLGLTLTNSVVMPLTGDSWRITFLCCGVLVLLVGLLWWFLARDIRSEVTTPNIGFINVFKTVIRIRNVQLILIAGLLIMVTLHGFSNWLPKLLQSSGVSPAAAGLTAAAPIIAGIVGVLTLPRVIPARLRGRALAVHALCVAIALSIVSQVSGIPQLIVLIMYGFAASSFLPMLVLILMDGCGIESKYLGSAGGIFFCIAEIGGFTGPLLMGILVDMTGSFSVGLLSLAALNLVVLIITFQIKSQVPRLDEMKSSRVINTRI